MHLYLAVKYYAGVKWNEDILHWQKPGRGWSWSNRCCRHLCSSWTSDFHLSPSTQKKKGHLSKRFLTATMKKTMLWALSVLYLIDACRHLLYKKPLLLSLTDQTSEEGETVVVGPGWTGRGLWGYIRRRWRRPAEYTQYWQPNLFKTALQVKLINLSF